MPGHKLARNGTSGVARLRRVGHTEAILPRQRAETMTATR